MRMGIWSYLNFEPKMNVFQPECLDSRLLYINNENKTHLSIYKYVNDLRISPFFSILVTLLQYNMT